MHHDDSEMYFYLVLNELFFLKLGLCFICTISPTHRRKSTYYFPDPKELYKQTKYF